VQTKSFARLTPEAQLGGKLGVNSGATTASVACDRHTPIIRA
jgi:hypothetical protein